jgi:predicted Zn finger-like uncharacterized protein
MGRLVGEIEKNLRANRCPTPDVSWTMKLRCPSCDAKYTISDERFAGRRVTVRCRRCGEAFPVDLPHERGQMCDVAAAAPPAEPAEPAPTSAPPKALVGERNESSVLFSLAMLANNAPPKASPAATENDASPLIDLRALSAAMSEEKEEAPASPAYDIAHLGGASLFAALAAPVSVGPQQEPEARRSKTPLVLASAALVVVAVAFAAIVARPPASALASAEIPAAVVSQPVASRVAPPVANVANPSGDDAPPPSAPSVIVAPRARGATVAALATPARATVRTPDAHDVASPPSSARAATVVSPPPKCCPGESETTCQVRSSVGAPCGNEPPSTSPSHSPPPFDRPSAFRALAVDVAGCKRADGPTGAGHVRVTFQSNGSVSAIDVAPPFSGTTIGACVAQRYRAATVPAFSGGALTVGKSFTIP